MMCWELLVNPSLLFKKVSKRKYKEEEEIIIYTKEYEKCDS